VAPPLEVDPPEDDPLDDDPLDDDPLDDDPLDDDPLAAGVEAAALSVEPEDSAPDPAGLASAAGLASPAGFWDAYRSLYQPLPLSWNAVREISRSRLPPQTSQVVLSGSDIRCWYSNSRLQALH
jgi:hypothetical protein